MSAGKTDSSMYHGLQHITVPCRACGDPVPAHIAPGARPPVKMCWPCLSYPTRHVERSDSTELEWVTSNMVRFSMAGPVTIYRPGDPGFDERAAEVDLDQRKKPHVFYRAVG